MRLLIPLALIACEPSDDPVDPGTTSDAYGRDYDLILFEGRSLTGRRDLNAHVELGGTRILDAPTATDVLAARWDLQVTSRIDGSDAFAVSLYEPGAGSIVSDSFSQTPLELLESGEMTFTGPSGELVVRAFAPGDAPECLQDDECAGGEHCSDEACEVGDRCGSTICAGGEVCGDGTCATNPLTAPHVLMVASADMGSGNWDSGLEDPAPDTSARVYLDDVLVLQTATIDDDPLPVWTDSVTDSFSPWSQMRVIVEDRDVQGADVAIDLTLDAIPWELVRDGSITLQQAGTASVTLTLTPAP